LTWRDWILVRSDGGDKFRVPGLGFRVAAAL
jgi:hypothetical protein